MAITQMPLLKNKIKEDSIVETGSKSKENTLKQQVAINKNLSKFPQSAPTVASIDMPWNNLEDLNVKNLRNDSYGILYPCRHVCLQRSNAYKQCKTNSVTMETLKQEVTDFFYLSHLFCEICGENLRNDNYGILYPCRHVFCQDCIIKTKATKNFICPLCRSNIRWTPSFSYKHLSRYMIALIATVIMICFLAPCFILVCLMIVPV